MSEMRLTFKLAIMILCYCSAFLISQNIYANQVTIAESKTKQSITIEIKDATLSDVLAEIGKNFNFHIKGLEKNIVSDRFSATYQGTLQTILDRLLRNRNYMIVHREDKKQKIDKLVILDTKVGSQPSNQVIRNIREKSRKVRIRRITNAIKSKGEGSDFYE